MRIGWDVSKAIAPSDGIGIFCQQLLRALLDLDDDTTYELYGLRREVEDGDLGGLTGGSDRALLVRGRSPSAPAVDLFHAAAWALPPSFHGPVLFSCYDLTFLSHPECHLLDNKVQCLTGTLEALLGGASFVAISAATAAEVERWLGVPRQQVPVIHPGVGERFRPLEPGAAVAQVRRRFGIETSFVLAVGTLEPRKNIGRLFAAWSGLPEEVRRCYPLVIAGGSSWKQETLRAELEASPGVHLLGRVEEDELVALYGAAAVFAYPSLAEGFGLPVAEAMACGAAVLTADRSALPEVAGDAACLVDPEDVEAIRAALAHLLGDPAARGSFARRAPGRAARFRWDEAARRTVELYRSLVGAAEAER